MNTASLTAPRGRVFFVDDRYRTPEELIEGPESSAIKRCTPDGTAYRIVKVPYESAAWNGSFASSAGT